MVKVFEVLGSAPKQPAVVLPAAVKQQQRVNGVVQQLAADDAKPKPATEMELVLAMRQMSAKRKQADFAYAQRMRQQLANADAQLKPRQ